MLPGCKPSIERKQRLLVLGLGNYLCGDDSIGFRLADTLAGSYDHPRVDIINGGTIGLGLLYLFEDYSDLIILDGIDVGAVPGAIYRFRMADLDKISREQLVSSHQEGAANLLRYARLLGRLPQRVTIVGIQIKTITREVGLSNELDVELDNILASIEKEIDRYVLECMN